ncbi:MAG: DedA family protein [Synechococcaceae cyanobacterium]|nr:DedA family protein [Synechococcaceae cyanobacterium]
MPTADGVGTLLIEAINDLVSGSPPLAYLLIALAMLLENVFPPLPSELIMPLGGFLVHQGKLALLPLLLAGLSGSVLGAWFWYQVGRRVDERRLERWLQRRGRWLGVSPSLLPRSRRWFDRHGVPVVFWGRLIPGLRPFVSLPAGFELMPQHTFLLWTSAGSLVWVGTLTGAGMALGTAYLRVVGWLTGVTQIVMAVVVGLLSFAACWVLVKAVRVLSRR